MNKLKALMGYCSVTLLWANTSFAALGDFANQIGGGPGPGKQGPVNQIQGDQGVMDAAGKIIYYIEVGGLIMGLLAFLAGGYMMTTNKAEGAKFAFIGGVIMLMASGIVMSFAK
jgi:hypothetical protein